MVQPVARFQGGLPPPLVELAARPYAMLCVYGIVCALFKAWFVLIAQREGAWSLDSAAAEAMHSSIAL
jgi:hypothetical protein